jgi:CMP/dCMP kinase
VKIAISGRSGCGNTSVSRLVAEQLGYRMINYTFRTMADELGISFAELRKRAEQDDRYDRMLDEKQVALAAEGDCVLGSRLAIWMLEDADLKVYMDADVTVRSERISRRENRPYEEVLAETKLRDLQDSARYRRIYGIDTDQFQFADLVLNTDDLDQYQSADAIAAAAGKLLRRSR